MKTNSFSKHDNRHTTENFGIHLGGGLGKKLTEPHRDQHRSDGQLFAHNEGSQHKFISTYVSGYRLKFNAQEGAQRRCSSAMEDSTAHTHSTAEEKDHVNVYSIGSTKETFHRYPQKYSLPKNKEGARPSVNTIWWYGSSTDSGSAQGRDSPGGEQKVRCLTSLERSCIEAKPQNPHVEIDTNNVMNKI